MHDFEFRGAAEMPRPYDPANYGLPIWRDEDHQPPQAEKQEAETAPEAVESDAPGAIQRSVEWMLAIAADNRHGYSQADRWGPDYDCSSFVITAWEQAGVPVKTAGATYTGNMYDAFVRCGFEDVTAFCNLANGAGMQYGDVLLNHQRHTATYIGNGQLVHARSSEGNSLRGDQSGNEIRVQQYYNYPWTAVLRYAGDRPTNVPTSGVPDIDAGDKPDEQRFFELRFSYLRKGDTGDAVRVAQTLLQARNIYCGPYGADGDFGNGTEKAVMDFQRRHNLTIDGVVGPETGAALLGGEVYTIKQAEPKAESVLQSVLTKIRERRAT